VDERGTVSVIDGSINKVVAGVTFNVHPAPLLHKLLSYWSGKLICNLDLEDTAYRVFYNRFDEHSTDVDNRDIVPRKMHFLIWRG
jgi:hypothetical protein